MSASELVPLSSCKPPELVEIDGHEGNVICHILGGDTTVRMATGDLAGSIVRFDPAKEVRRISADGRALYRCADCGMDLTLTAPQIEWVLEHGNPIPRPPCPRNASGLHRVAREQIDAALSSTPQPTEKEPNAMEEEKIAPAMGDRVRDVVTGKVGVITGQSEYLWGCLQFLVYEDDATGTDGQPVTHWWDVGRLEVIEQGVVSAITRPSVEPARATGSDLPGPVR